jgi:HEAT repeat protein
MHETGEFEQALQRLRETPLSDAALYRFSNLHSQELALLARAWPALPVDQRQRIVSRMVEMSETDFEVDFSELFKIALGDQDPYVRTAAIEGLWEVEDVALIRPLIRLLKKDEAEIVREAAAISLSRFALLAELGRLSSRYSVMVWDALWDAVHDPQEDLSVRRRAVESLAYFDRPEVAQVIRRAYADEEDIMRISAVFAMGRSADETWNDQVMAELAREDPAMRYEAARASGALRISEAVPLLSKMVADPDIEVKLMAVWAMGQIGGSEARRVLEICCEIGDEALRDAAEEALEELEFGEGTLDFPLYDFDMDTGQEDMDEWEDEEETG